MKNFWLRACKTFVNDKKLGFKIKNFKIFIDENKQTKKILIAYNFHWLLREFQWGKHQNVLIYFSLKFSVTLL